VVLEEIPLCRALKARYTKSQSDFVAGIVWSHKRFTPLWGEVSDIHLHGSP